MSQPKDPNGQQPTGYTSYDPVTGQPLSQPIPTGYDPTTGQPQYQQPPSYGAPQYGQPSAQAPYGQQQYAQPQQPYGYQPGYPPAGYGYPVVPPPAKRPGTAVAIAVLNFVQSFSVLWAGVAFLAGADIFNTYGDYGRSGIGGFGTELTLIAVITLVAGALLVAGGVTVLSNKLPLTYAGCGLSLALSVYWFIRPTAAGIGEIGGLIGLVLMWSVLPIIALSLTPSVNKWVQQRRSAV